MGKTLTLEQPQIIQEVPLIPHKAENVGAATSWSSCEASPGLQGDQQQRPKRSMQDTPIYCGSFIAGHSMSTLFYAWQWFQKAYSKWVNPDKNRKNAGMRIKKYVKHSKS